MRRKQIYIEEAQERDLEILAEREKTTVSALVRRALTRYIDDNITPLVKPEDHPLWQLIGIVDDPDAPTDGSTTYKRDLYGPKQ